MSAINPAFAAKLDAAFVSLNVHRAAAVKRAFLSLLAVIEKEYRFHHEELGGIPAARFASLVEERVIQLAAAIASEMLVPVQKSVKATS